MGTEWVPQAVDDVDPGGDVGGDRQVGESYSVRFVAADGRHAPRAPGEFGVITVYIYAVSAGGDEPEDARNGGDDAEFGVEVQAEFTLCRDPERPGDTEAWADNRVYELPGTYDDVASADGAAHHIAHVMAAGYCPPEIAAWERRVRLPEAAHPYELTPPGQPSDVWAAVDAELRGHGAIW